MLFLPLGGCTEATSHHNTILLSNNYELCLALIAPLRCSEGAKKNGCVKVSEVCTQVRVCNRTWMQMTSLPFSVWLHRGMELRYWGPLLGQMVWPGINSQVLVCSLMKVHQAAHKAEAAARERMWGGMEPNEWIPEGAGGITDSSIEKVGRIIHLFIICGIILIGIQFNSVCVCVCAYNHSARWTLF